MNITHYQRLPLTARSSVVRFTDLNDELNRLFGSAFAGLTENVPSAEGWSPVLDVYEDKENFVIQAELPGLKREDIDVSLHEGTLTIAGERQAVTRPEDAEIYCAERKVGRFQRAVVLPTTVATDRVKAGYTDGVLTVTVPKTEEAKPKKIDVAVN